MNTVAMQTKVKDFFGKNYPKLTIACTEGELDEWVVRVPEAAKNEMIVDYSQGKRVRVGDMRELIIARDFLCANHLADAKKNVDQYKLLGISREKVVCRAINVMAAFINPVVIEQELRELGFRAFAVNPSCIKVAI